MNLKKFFGTIFISLLAAHASFANEVMSGYDANSTVKNETSSNLAEDSAITAKVKGMFVQKKLFGDKDIAAITISVETTDGKVLLSGTADNQEQIDNAIKIAKSIEGVKSVQSTVTISP